MSKWLPISLSDKLFLNVKDAMLTQGTAALENAYQNDVGGISRFPGLDSFVTLGGKLQPICMSGKATSLRYPALAFGGLTKTGL